MKGLYWQRRPHCHKMQGRKCPFYHHCQQQHQQLLSKLPHLLFLRQQQQPKHPLCHQQQLSELLHQRLRQLSRQLLLPFHQYLAHPLQKQCSQTRLPHSCQQYHGGQLSKTLD